MLNDNLTKSKFVGEFVERDHDSDEDTIDYKNVPSGVP